MSLKDKIFGREKLKEKVKSLERSIQRLEDEKEKLKRKADKEEDRAKEAFSKLQGLHEEINRKEDKIGSLEDELRKKELVDKAKGTKFKSRGIRRSETKDLVSKLGSIKSDKEDLITIFLPPDTSVSDVDSQGFIQTSLTLKQLKRLREEESNTGKVFFYADNMLKLLFKPPVPVREDGWKKDQIFHVDPVLESLDKTVGFVFLSCGGSAVAVFDHEIKEHKIVKSKVKDQHKKGGFSQGRFERSREEDMKRHIDDVLEAYKGIFSEDIDMVALCGSGDMVSKFKERNPFHDINVFEKNPNLSKITQEKDIKKAFKQFWTTEVTHL